MNISETPACSVKSLPPVKPAQESGVVTCLTGLFLGLWRWGVIGLVALAGCGREPEPPPSPPPQTIAPQRTLYITRTANPDNEAADPEPNEAAQPTTLPEYELRMAAADMNAIERQPRSNETKPATFVFGTNVFEGVQVRARGAFSRSWPKKSFKILFNKDKPFEGQHSLNLNSGWHDPAFIREVLAYHVYAACGAPASKCRMVRLNLNGKFKGLYVDVEQPDKAFLKRYNLKGASIYKSFSHGNQGDERALANEAFYRANYSKETQKDSGYGELQKFCQSLQQASNVREFFEQNVQIENYINYLAATVLTQNWDGFNKNHFLIYDGQGTRKWLEIPWDLDRTFGDHWNWSFEATDLPILLGTRRLPGVTGWNRLEERFFSEPTLTKKFFVRLKFLLETEFTTAKLYPLLDQWESEIRADAARDRRKWPGMGPGVHEAIAGVKNFIEERRNYLQSEIRNFNPQSN